MQQQLCFPVLEWVWFQGAVASVAAKMIHDFALYHTDLCFDTEEKIALFNLKFLWEGLEQLGKT